MGRKLLSLVLSLMGFIIVIAVMGAVIFVGWYVYLAVLLLGACVVACCILAFIYTSIKNYFINPR